MDNTRFHQMKVSFGEIIQRLKRRAKELKQNIALLYRAYKHPNTPWYAKAVSIVTITYALSPIDLIPDFIPVLGYLDDLIIVPAGIALSLRLIPKEIIDECKQMMGDKENIRRKGIPAAIIIVLLYIWVISLILKAFHLV